MTQEITRVAVVGLGKLGSCIAATFASAGFQVIATDLDHEKVITISEGGAPVNESGLDTLCEQVVNKDYLLTGTFNVTELVVNSDACFFIVPTPSTDSGRFDTSYLEQALTTVAQEVKKQNVKNYIFVINSTITPGSCDEIFYPLIKDILGHEEFGLCYKPELIALGSVLRDLCEPDIVLIGTNSDIARNRVFKFYSKVVKNYPHFVVLSAINIELAKIALNCFITMKISFANQIGMIADDIGADGAEVLKAIGYDSRIGRKCLAPGLPFGGPCFPRDNRMLSSIARFAPLAIATDKINEEVKKQVFRSAVIKCQIEQCETVGILGMAYKPGTSLTEESLGLWLEEHFKTLSFKVKTYDPQAECNSTVEEVLACPVVVVACAWPEFQTILQSANPRPNLVDPMNFIQCEQHNNTPATV